MSKQRGFTLIELLVVVAILSVIAAVVILNVGDFFGVGRVQAANTELHQVNTAITAYIATTEGSDSSFNATIGPGSNYPLNATYDEGVHRYLYGELQANYLIESGAVVNATTTEDSRWGDLYFCNGVWQEEECS